MLTGRRAFDARPSATPSPQSSRKTRLVEAAEQPRQSQRAPQKMSEAGRETTPHDIADARLEIEEAQAALLDSSGELPFEEKTASPKPLQVEVLRRRPREEQKVLYLSWALAAAFAAATGARRAARSRPAGCSGPGRRFTLSRLSLSVDTSQSLVLSPDGAKLVYRGRGEDGYFRLYMRALDSFDEKAIRDGRGRAPVLLAGQRLDRLLRRTQPEEVALSADLAADLPAKGFIGAGPGCRRHDRFCRRRVHRGWIASPPAAARRRGFSRWTRRRSSSS